MGREATIALLLLLGACARQRLPATRSIAGVGSEVEISGVLERRWKRIVVASRPIPSTRLMR
jgi:hypothetical protein